MISVPSQTGSEEELVLGSEIGETNLEITYATESDYEYIRDRDHHILESLISPKIKQNEIYILRNPDEGRIGWLRYGYFWDNTPFMNMIWIEEQHRGNGIGKQSVLFWESEMKQKGFGLVMTSTLSNEDAQHFYRKLGYRDAGGLLLYDEPLEIFLTKTLL